MWWIQGYDNISRPPACTAMTPAGCIDEEGRGQITYTPGKKNSDNTWTHILCHAICAHFFVFHLFLFPFTKSVSLFLNQYFLLSFFLYLQQATVHGLDWSPHLLVWGVMEVPVSQGVLSQPDLYLSPTLKMRTPWCRWQNTSLLGLVRPCVPTVTWSSGEGHILYIYFLLTRLPK